jgi:hypothetical protein
MTPETELRRLYQSNNNAKALMDYLADREKGRKELVFDRAMTLLQSEGVTRSRLREVFRRLEKLGFGEFKVGRRGHKTRFEWHRNLIELAHEAQGKSRRTKVAA